MRIYKPIGSKDRLFEIFQKVNTVNLNEGMFESDGQDINAQNILNNTFNQLKNNGLDILEKNTQGGDESFLELKCKDNQGNNIIFRFETNSSEGDQEGVYNVNDVKLINFIFNSGNENVELDKDGLTEFNSEHSGELFDVIEKYIDIESSEPEDFNELAEAIKLIDAIKKDSYPYGGGSDELQNGKAYADEKPVNPKLRVKSPELDKYIQEDTDYPTGIGKEFSTELNKSKIKRKNKKKVKLSESDQDEEELTSDKNSEETPEFKTDDIEQLAQDKEEVGDMLQGGLGDDKSPLDFNPEQILKGLDVEKEHTDNPMIALEIVMDHLSEDPEYYTAKDNSDDSAQFNAAKDISVKETDKSDDEETTNLLLGYKPINVGETFDYNSEKEYHANDRYNRYLQLSQKVFNELSDIEKEEFFQLWNEFKDEDNNEEQMNVDERAVNPQELEAQMSQEPYVSVKKGILKYFASNSKYAGIDADSRADEIIKRYHSWILNISKRYEPNEIAGKLFNNYIEKTMGNKAKGTETQQAASPDSMQKFYDERMNNLEFKPVVNSMKEILKTKGLNDEQINSRVSEIFSKNFTNIVAKLARRVPVNLVAKMFVET